MTSSAGGPPPARARRVVRAAGPPSPEPAVLPDRTCDESDVGWGSAIWRDEPDEDERYLRERPPHWE